ncbi:MAG: caspase family protein [Alphaproteobacteria bacterium]
MRIGTMALAAILLLVLPVGAEAARKALVIGNGAYKAQRLVNPANDAADMAARLAALRFAVTTATDATRSQMVAAVLAFRRGLAAGDEVVVFYAGHGMQVGGQNWLIPVDAEPRDEAEVEAVGVGLDWILRNVAEAGARTTLMLLDACRDNPFAKSFRSGTRGLARLEAAASGTLVSYAARPGTVAADGKGRNSPYTAAWLAALAEPGLTHHQILDRVHHAVRQATGERQETWEEGRLAGTLILNDAAAATPAPSPSAPGAQTPPAPVPLPAMPPTAAARGWIGIVVQGVTSELAQSLGMPEARGALIASVRENGPAAAAGIAAGDVVLSFATTPADNADHLLGLIANQPPGSVAEVTIWRDRRVEVRRLIVGQAGDPAAAPSPQLPPGSPFAEFFQQVLGQGQAVRNAIGTTVAELDAESRRLHGVPAGTTGVLVTAVEPGSAADTKGMKPGDVIVEVQQQEVPTIAALHGQVADAVAKGRRSVLLLVSFQGDQRFVALPLAGQ